MTGLEDACAELEEGHDDPVEQKLKVDRLLPHEVDQHRLFNHKQQDTLDLLNTKRKKTGTVAHIKKVTYVSVLVSLVALVGGSELCWSCFDEGLISGSLCSSSSENSIGSIIEVGVGRRSGLNLLSESNLKPQSSQLLT